MIIKGFQKTSLVDFPGLVVSTVFVAGCNFRCGFCHNPELVDDDHSLREIPWGEILSELESRKNFIDGVCVSGGEPTVHSDLPEFLMEIKKLNLKVKLDTNGSNPQMLGELIERGFVDYISMDVKSSLGSYSRIVSKDVDTEAISRSISILMGSGIDYEFRTTAVPGLFDMEELKSVCNVINGAKRYFIQQFKATTSLIDGRYAGTKPFSEEELKGFVGFASQFVRECGLRNV